MTRERDNQIGYITFVVALLLLAAGCQTDPSKSYGTDDFYRPAGPHRSTSQFKTAQAAAAARHDATLRAVHFDGDELNSLGRAKLDLMLADDDAIDAMTVYIDADDAAMAPRAKSVSAYLTDKGLTSKQFAFESGQNPNNFHPVAPDLANLNRTDSGSSNSSGESGMNALDEGLGADAAQSSSMSQ